MWSCFIQSAHSSKRKKVFPILPTVCFYELFRFSYWCRKENISGIFVIFWTKKQYRKAKGHQVHNLNQTFSLWTSCLIVDACLKWVGFVVGSYGSICSQQAWITEICCCVLFLVKDTVSVSLIRVWSMPLQFSWEWGQVVPSSSYPEKVLQGELRLQRKAWAYQLWSGIFSFWDAAIFKCNKTLETIQSLSQMWKYCMACFLIARASYKFPRESQLSSNGLKEKIATSDAVPV